ncbi:MAG: hypothetical protein L7S56_05555 [Candidatus Poseidonia sp.]|nr:hypothetical protein [Poseidonia sp.]
MTVTPMDLVRYARGVQWVLTGYTGLTKEKRLEADREFRQVMHHQMSLLRRFLEQLHDDSWKQEKMMSVRRIKSTMGEVDAFLRELDKAISPFHVTYLSGQQVAKNQSLLQLLEHDRILLKQIRVTIEAFTQTRYDSVEEQLDECHKNIMICQTKLRLRQYVLRGAENQ